MGGPTTEQVADVFRREHGRAVSVLIGRFGDIDLAEECVQDAFEAALRRWPQDGLPPSPAGWIVTTARNRAIDHLRRESVRAARHADAATLGDPVVPGPADLGPEGFAGDDRLRLFFTCCHPALAPEARVALTLRLLGGLTTDEVARAFLVSPATMAQRLVRAKAKIRDTGIPYRIPETEELPERLAAVLGAVYLIYTEGHTSGSGADPVRADLCLEAVRLARALHQLLPAEPEVRGLLALLLLTESRRPARLRDGRLVPLAEQDRRRWDLSLIAEGQRLVQECLAENRPGPYQVQAAIGAVHSSARTMADTDWTQVLALYDQLLSIAPTPVVRLNRAVALAEVEGPEAALAAVAIPELSRYHLLHAVHGDLLDRLGRTVEAAEALERAAALTANPLEQAHLRDRVRRLQGDAGGRGDRTG